MFLDPNFLFFCYYIFDLLLFEYCYLWWLMLSFFFISTCKWSLVQFCLVLGSSWYLIFLTSTTLWFYIWAEVPFSLVTLVDCIGESYFFYSDALFFTPSTSWLSDLVDIILGLFFVFIGLTFYRVLLRMQWFGLVYLCGNLFFFFRHRSVAQMIVAIGPSILSLSAVCAGTDTAMRPCMLEAK